MCECIYIYIYIYIYIVATQGSNGRHLWEFIRDLLLAGDNGDKAAAEIIRWENRDDGIFRIVDSKQVAQLWGIRKRNKTMTYEKLSRALRSAAQAVAENYRAYAEFVTVQNQKKIKIVYSVWQQCMLHSHNYNIIQIQISVHIHRATVT